MVWKIALLQWIHRVQKGRVSKNNTKKKQQRSWILADLFREEYVQGKFFGSAALCAGDSTQHDV